MAAHPNEAAPNLGLTGALRFVALAGAYVAAGQFGLTLAFENPSATPVWPPTGIAIAALLISGTQLWPAVALGAFTVNVMTTGSVPTSSGVALGNTLEALLAAELVSRFANGRWAIASTRHVVTYIGAAGLLSPVASATVGVLSLDLGGRIAPGSASSTWLTWWLGDAVGALVVAPFILLWFSRPFVRWTARKQLEGALWILLLIVVNQALYGGLIPPEARHYPWPIAVIPLLICVSIRFGALEAMGGLVLVSAIATWGTLHGFGPFAVGTPHASLLALQSFLGIGAVLTLVPAVMIAERRLAETRLRAFFDQAVVGIADCDLDGRFLRVNQWFCDMLGYPRELLLQRSILDVTHPEDQAATRALFDGLKANATPHSVDKRYVRADGTTLWVRAMASRVTPGSGQPVFATTVLEDITSRKQVEVAVLEHGRIETRLRAFFDQAMVGIADVDLECRFLRVNQCFCDMLGYTREGLFAQTLLDVTHPEDRAMTRARFERLKVDGRPSSVDKRYVRSDGTTLWVRVMASRVLAGPGESPFAATIVEDITSRKQAEGAIRRAARLEERTRIAGEMHDDLSQSLVGIVLQLENALDVLPKGAVDLKHYVEGASQLARTAVDDARRSIRALRPSSLESDPLPDALRASMVEILAGTGVEQDFRCEGVVRPLAQVVEEELFYIGKEAITNARRHGTPTRLSCRLRYQAAELELEVADNGRGFEMGQESGRFGLINMEERTRRLGGRLSIRSDPGQGTSILVQVPLPPSEGLTAV